MTKQVCRAVVLGLAAVALAWAAEGAEPVQQDAETAKRDQAFKDAMAQMEELDEKMFEHLTHLPDKLDFAAQEAVIRQVAAKSDEISESNDLGKIEVKPVASTDRLRLSDGRLSPIEISRLEISGRAPFGRVHTLLTWVHVRTWRFAELDTLHLRAEEDGTVRFDVRLAYPSITEWPEDPEGQRGWRSPDDMLVQMVGKKRLLLELLEDISARSDFARLVDALVVLGLALEDKAVGLTEVRYDGVAVIQGFALGQSARDGLGPALEKAGFHVVDVKTSPLGSCQAFTVRAEVKPAERSEEFTIANGLFEAKTAAYCEPVASAGRVTVRGTAAAADALTLHLRAVEMIEVFQLLNELTSASFLVDEDVEGRIRLDVEGATLDETLAALGSVGVAVGPGPIRRVTRAGKQPAAAAPVDYCAELMDIRVRNASLTEVLCTFNHVAQRPILAPPDLRGTVSLYGSNLRVDQMIEAMAAASGLVSVVDSDRLLLGRGTAAEIRGRKDAMSVCEIRDDGSPGSSGYSRLRSLSPDLKQLAAGDLELAGLVRQGETWTAWAFTPTGKLRTLKAGDRLSGASVNAVGPDGVTLATDASGTVNLALRP